MRPRAIAAKFSKEPLKQGAFANASFANHKPNAQLLLRVLPKPAQLRKLGIAPNKRQLRMVDKIG